MAKVQYSGFGDVVPFQRGLASYSRGRVEGTIPLQNFLDAAFFDRLTNP